MATAPKRYGKNGALLKYVEGLGWYNTATGLPEDPKSLINTQRLGELFQFRLKLDNGKVLDPVQQKEANSFQIATVRDAQTGKYIDYAVSRTAETGQEKVTVLSVGSSVVSDPVGVAKDLINTDNQFNPISDFFGGSPGTLSGTADKMISIGVSLMFVFGILSLFRRH